MTVENAKKVEAKPEDGEKKKVEEKPTELVSRFSSLILVMIF